MTEQRLKELLAVTGEKPAQLALDYSGHEPVFCITPRYGGGFNACLPWPPSANHYWRRGWRKRGRYHREAQFMISEEGRRYRRFVRQLAQLAGKVEPISRPAYIKLMAIAKDERKRDLDNLLKPTLDALENAGLVRDDSLFDSIGIIRGVTCPGEGHIYIEAGYYS